MGLIARDTIRKPAIARGGRLKALLLGTVFSSAALSPYAAQAQQLYVNADGTRTTDLTAAAATWAALPSFLANPALATLNAQYAYAMGIDGNGVKLGLVDTSVAVNHPDLVGSRLHTLTTTGVYTKDGVFNTSIAGQPFTLSASDLGLNVYSGDIHGTAMSGFIVAQGASGTDPNGNPWPRGLAPGSDLSVARSIGQFFPPSLKGIDGAVMGAAYDAVVAAGARAVNGEWQITQAPGSGFAGVVTQYKEDPNNGALLGMARAAAAGVVVLMPGGNQNREPVGVGASLPNFVAGIESHWLAVTATANASGALTGYSNICGPSKWWCITATAHGNAPSYMTQDGTLIPSTDNPITYTTYVSGGLGGTSEASADALAAMGLVMARFPYMTSQQARDVLLTTAAPVGGQTGVNDQNGFGLIDLRRAMQGPGQFLGTFQANLPTGASDTWTNDISEAALVQRRQEAEDLRQQSSPAAQQAALARAQQLIANLRAAVAGASSLGPILPAFDAARADPIASLVLGQLPGAITIYQDYLNSFSDSELWAFLGSSITAAAAPLGNVDYAPVLAGIRAQNDVAQAWLAGFGGGPVAGSLVKTGGGTLTLTGTNTFSGGVTLAGGGLSVSREANLGAPSGGLTFNGGILQVTGTSFTATARAITWGAAGGGFDIAAPANTFTVAQALSGAGGLTKLGAGTLALAGANTYTGGSAITAGTLEARGGQAIGDLSAVTVAAGATLALRQSETIGSLAGGGSVALGTARLTAGGNNTSTLFAGTLSGAGGLTKAGLGTLTLTGANTYAGLTTVAAGTLQIGNGGTTGSIAGDVLNNAILAFNRADALTFAGTIGGTGSLNQIGTGTLTLTGANPYTGGTTITAGTLQIGNGGTAGSIAGDVLNNSTLAFNRADAVTFAGIIGGSGSLNQIGTGTLTLTGANTYTGGTAITAGTLQIGNGGTIGSIAGDILNNSTLAFNRADALTFAGIIGGTGNLTKLGAGTLALAGANTYSGGTAITAGTLEARGGQAIGDLSAVTVAAGATLALRQSETIGSLAGSGSVALGTARLTAGGNTSSTLFAGTLSGAGGLTKAGLGTLTLTGANTYAGGTTIAAGTLQIGNGGTAGSITGDVLNNSTLAFNRADAVTFAGIIGGTGVLNQNGTGTLTLTGANTYAGLTTVAAGTLQIGNGGTTGSITGDVLNNATLAFNRADAVTFAGIIGGTGSLNQIGTGTLTLTGANTYTGGTVITAGTLQIGNGGTAGSITGDVLNNSTLAFNRADAVTFAGAITGSGSLNQIGAGTLTLTGANTYTGGTAITAGTLQIGGGGTAGSITGDVLNNATLAFNRADAITFAGIIGGTGNLNQIGTGTLTLTGASTHTGLTTVAAGGLALTATASLVSPVVTLAGTTLTNAGRLTGGLVNGGTTATSGIIAGGLTNTGSLTATAGQVNGAIRNLAGRFSVTGAVSSDATFANAAGAALTVSGSYGLAGLLTNAGTLTVAAGGRLTAAGVDNAGVLTVAAQASVIDALTNTGFLSNAGTYTADARNAAGATLVNSGTFSTVSQPFANAGTLVTTGVLNGGLTNTGTVQAAGQLNGAVANTGLIQLIGTTTGIARLTNDGAFDLGTTALSVGSLAGSTAAASLGNGRLTVGTDGSSTTYAGRIIDGDGATGLTKVGGGALTLSGDSRFTGPLTVLGGELTVTGTLAGGAARFGTGTLLSGQASFASLALSAGSTVAPGAGPGAVGRVAVIGDLSFAPGATYRVDATADGRSDRIVAGGRATLTGAGVQAIADTGLYAPRTRYTILSAAGGLSGQFAGVTANFAFLTPFLSYDANDAYLTLARNDLTFTAVAQTRNQRAAAAAVQAGAVGSPLYDAVATLSAGQARAAFASLSGDAHASLASTAFATAGLLREAVLDQLRWDARPVDDRTLPAAYAADRPGHPAALSAVPARVLDPQAFTLWGQGFGSTGRAGTDGNAATLSRTTGGFLFGADARLENGLRLGLTGGYRTTSFATPGSAESGSVDGAFGGLYGAYRLGPMAVRFGALAADDAVSLRRLVQFPGFNGTPSVRTGGTTAQGFGEVGYRFGLGAAMLEPFAGGAVVSIRRDRFTELGGPAALGGAAQDDTIPVSTVGMRGQMEVDLGLGMRAFVHGLLGYRHAFGAVIPVTRLTVLGTGASFTSAGLPIDRDALVAEAGVSVRVTPNATLGVSYTGQVGQRAQDHAARGTFTLRF
ncbi:autotransporter-associated beta strand repeat-containing protein [Methylobacterium oryzisoli]|uniref:autotransporter-associated beta strand repeat-containing protein n=1 Tax=Methylobacterium oryzisoli TaxID=3385502 RepID=UPI00389168C7